MKRNPTMEELLYLWHHNWEQHKLKTEKLSPVHEEAFVADMENLSAKDIIGNLMKCEKYLIENEEVLVKIRNTVIARKAR